MQPLRLQPVAWTLVTFLTITYISCILFGIIFPSQWHQFRQVLEMVLPGFKWLSFGSFLTGLFLMFLYGLYTAVLFVTLYNYFSRKILPNRDEYSSRF